MTATRRASRLVVAGLALLVAGPAPAGPSSWLDLDGEARSLISAGRPAEALVVAERAVREAEQALGPEHADVGRCLGTKGRALTKLRLFEEAEGTYQRLLTILEAAGGPERWNLGIVLSNMGGLSAKAGRFGEAEARWRRALAIVEEVRGPKSDVAGQVLRDLAEAISRQHREAEAVPLLERVVALAEDGGHWERPWAKFVRQDLAALLKALGDEALRASSLADAKRRFARCLALLEQAHGPGDPRLWEAVTRLARAEWWLGELAEAEAHLRRAVELLEPAGKKRELALAYALGQLGEVGVALGRPADAERHLRRALELLERNDGHPLEYGRLLTGLARARLAQGPFEAEAEPLLRRALAVIEQAAGPEAGDLAEPLTALASVEQVRGRIAEAERLLQRAADILETRYGPGHPNRAVPLTKLGFCRLLSGRPGEAIAPLRRAIAIVEERHGRGHPALVTPLSILGWALVAQKQLSEAEPLLVRAVDLGGSAPRAGQDGMRVMAFLGLATIRVGQLRKEEGVGLFERAVTEAEASSIPAALRFAPYLSFGAFLLQDGQAGRAVSLLQHASELGVKDVRVEGQVRALLARAYREVGRAAEAEALEAKVDAGAAAKD